MASLTSARPLIRLGGPVYTHDCTNCRFIGTVDRIEGSHQIPPEVTEVDLYAHASPHNPTDDVVARYGNEPAQVIMGREQSPFVVARSPEPHLTAAASRAIQLGLMRV